MDRFLLEAAFESEGGAFNRKCSKAEDAQFS